jgi:hypothetical protein
VEKRGGFMGQNQKVGNAPVSALAPAPDFQAGADDAAFAFVQDFHRSFFPV